MAGIGRMASLAPGISAASSRVCSGLIASSCSPSAIMVGTRIRASSAAVKRGSTVHISLMSRTTEARSSTRLAN